MTGVLQRGAWGVYPAPREFHGRPHMGEKEPIFSGDIRYSEGDLLAGLEWARSELGGFKHDLESPDDLARDIARQTIPQYQKAVQFASLHSPDEMFSLLTTIFNRTHTLEASGIKQIEIGRKLSVEFGDQISALRVILRPSSGWIKPLCQWTYAASK